MPVRAALAHPAQHDYMGPVRAGDQRQDGHALRRPQSVYHCRQGSVRGERVGKRVHVHCRSLQVQGVEVRRCPAWAQAGRHVDASQQHGHAGAAKGLAKAQPGLYHTHETAAEDEPSRNPARTPGTCIVAHTSAGIYNHQRFFFAGPSSSATNRPAERTGDNGRSDRSDRHSGKGGRAFDFADSLAVNSVNRYSSS